MPRRALNLFDLVCLGTNAIVGSGVYLFPGRLAALLGPASVLAFGLCGAISLIIALCFAELAGKFDRSGGPYLYARSAFGGSVGYLVGWTCWSAAVLSWASVTRGLVAQLGYLWPALAAGGALTSLAVVMTLALGAINYRGIRAGAWTTNVLTVAKLLPLLLLTGVGLSRLRGALLAPFAPRGFAPLPRATFFTFFAFQGFEVVPVPAGESNNPRRDAPLAAIGSLIGATGLYMLLQLAAVGTTPEMVGSSEPLPLMASRLLGTFGGQFVALAAVISMLGFCAGVAMAGPRYLEPLAADGYLPAALSVRHDRFATPHRAIALTTGLTALLVLVLDFAALVDLSVFFVAVQYLSSCAAVVVLRRKDGPGGSQGFVLPWGALIPVLALISVVALVGYRLVSQWDPRLVFGFTTLLALGAGLAAATSTRKRRRGGG